MTSRVYLLPASHGDDCPVCGGDVRVRVALMRRRGDSDMPAWPLARLRLCPLSSGADHLREVLPAVIPGGGDAA